MRDLEHITTGTDVSVRVHGRDYWLCVGRRQVGRVTLDWFLRDEKFCCLAGIHVNETEITVVLYALEVSSCARRTARREFMIPFRLLLCSLAARRDLASSLRSSWFVFSRAAMLLPSGWQYVNTNEIRFRLAIDKLEPPDSMKLSVWWRDSANWILSSSMVLSSSVIFSSNTRECRRTC